MVIKLTKYTCILFSASEPISQILLEYTYSEKIKDLKKTLLPTIWKFTFLILQVMKVSFSIILIVNKLIYVFREISNLHTIFQSSISSLYIGFAQNRSPLNALLNFSPSIASFYQAENTILIAFLCPLSSFVLLCPPFPSYFDLPILLY